MQGLEGKLVVQATAGARHTVVLLDKGEVYGWGDCEQGQLGPCNRCEFFFVTLTYLHVYISVNPAKCLCYHSLLAVLFR